MTVFSVAHRATLMHKTTLGASPNSRETSLYPHTPHWSSQKPVRTAILSLVREEEKNWGLRISLESWPRRIVLAGFKPRAFPVMKLKEFYKRF